MKERHSLKVIFSFLKTENMMCDQNICMFLFWHNILFNAKDLLSRR